MTLATSLALALVSLATAAVLARALGVEGRGLFAAAAMVCTLSVGLGQLGLGQALVYSFRSSVGELPRSVIEISTMLVVSTSVLVALFASLTVPTLDPLMFALVLLWTGATAGLTFVSTSLQIQGTLASFNLLRLTSGAAVLVLVASIWVFSHLTPERAAAATTVVAVVAWVAAQRRLGELVGTLPPAGRWISHLSLGVRYHGTAVLGVVLTHLDKLYLLYSGTTRQLGLYSAAYGISRMLGLAQLSLSTALFARHAGATDQNTASSEIAARVFRLTFLPMILGACLAATLSGFIIALAFGNEFTGAQVLFGILVFEAVISAGSWLLAEQFNALGRPGAVLIRQGISIVPIIMLVWAVPPESAPVGLAMLMTLSAIVRLTTTLIQYRKLLHVRLGMPWPNRADIAWLRKSY